MVVEDFLRFRAYPPVCRNLMCFHECEVVCGGMVCRKEQQVISFSYRFVQGPEKVGQIFIKPQIGVFGFNGIRSELMAHIVR